MRLAEENDVEGFSEQETLLWGTDRKPRVGCAGSILLLIVTNLATALVTLAIASVNRHAQNKPSWSSEINHDTHIARFNAFEMPNGFTASPHVVGDAVEERWIDLGIYSKAMLVPLEYGSEYDLDPEKHMIHGPEKESDAPYAGYTVVMEVLHQLHCVNFLRQGLYYNYEYYRKSNHRSWKHDQDSVIEIHLAHCVDALRQFIMCEADVRLHPYLAPTGDKGDFAREKECKNFESARQFAIEHQWFDREEFWIDERHQNYTTSLSSEWSKEDRWTGY